MPVLVFAPHNWAVFNNRGAHWLAHEKQTAIDQGISQT